VRPTAPTIASEERIGIAAAAAAAIIYEAAYPATAVAPKASGVAHLAQNFRPGLFSAAQFGQINDVASSVT